VVLPFAVHMVSLLGCFCSLSAAFLNSYSVFLASPASWGLYRSLSFTLTLSLIALSCADYKNPDPEPQLLCIPGLSLKHGWKPSWLSNSCILHACKTSIMWTKPRSALAWVQHPWTMAVVVSECLGGWTWEEHFLDSLYEWGTAPKACFSKQTLPHELKLYTIGPMMGGFWPIPERPPVRLSFYRSTKYLISS
jgi:hypothetical protein